MGTGQGGPPLSRDEQTAAQPGSGAARGPEGRECWGWAGVYVGVLGGAVRAPGGVKNSLIWESGQNPASSKTTVDPAWAVPVPEAPPLLPLGSPALPAPRGCDCSPLACWPPSYPLSLTRLGPMHLFQQQTARHVPFRMSTETSSY